jgi:hypothetical protein
VKTIIRSLPGRLVRRHLDRLQASLETLGERLREAVSRVVGEAVADTVRELVRVLVSTPATAPFPRAPEVLREDWEERSWHDPYRQPWDDVDEDEPLAAYDDIVPAASPEALPVPARWSRAASVGCQAAAWWLRRQTGRFPVFTTLALGLAAALTAYVAGPLVVAGGAGVLGAVLGLLHLAQNVESGAEALRS